MNQKNRYVVITAIFIFLIVDRVVDLSNTLFSNTIITILTAGIAAALIITSVIFYYHKCNKQTAILCNLSLNQLSYVLGVLLFGLILVKRIYLNEMYIINNKSIPFMKALVYFTNLSLIGILSFMYIAVRSMKIYIKTMMQKGYKLAKVDMKLMLYIFYLVLGVYLFLIYLPSGLLGQGVTWLILSVVVIVFALVLLVMHIINKSKKKIKVMKNYNDDNLVS